MAADRPLVNLIANYEIHNPEGSDPTLTKDLKTEAGQLRKAGKLTAQEIADLGDIGLVKSFSVEDGF